LWSLGASREGCWALASNSSTVTFFIDEPPQKLEKTS
jgi:hypothetical protein